MIPDLSVLWVIALLMLCVFVLNTLIFKPILHVIDSRAAAVRDARELAASAAQKATEATQEFDRTLTGARAAVMADTKREAESALADATSRLIDQASAARAALESEANNLAGEIVNRVLGRTA